MKKLTTALQALAISLLMVLASPASALADAELGGNATEAGSRQVTRGTYFELEEGQEAVVTDYGNMRIVLSRIEQVLCVTTPCYPLVHLLVYAPEDIYFKTADSGTELTLAAPGSSAEVYGATIILQESDAKKAKLVVTKAKPEPLYVTLNEDFTLAIGQEAVVADYNEMRVKLLKTDLNLNNAASPFSATVEVTQNRATADGESAQEVAVVTLHGGQKTPVFGTTLFVKDLGGFEHFRAVEMRIEKADAVYCENSPHEETCVCKEGKKVPGALELCLSDGKGGCLPIYTCIPDAIYVELNQKFRLREKQTAILTEYKTLELRLNYLTEQPPQTVTTVEQPVTETGVTTNTVAPRSVQPIEPKPSEPIIEKNGTKRAPSYYYANVDLTDSSAESRETVNLNMRVGEAREVFGVRLSFLSVFMEEELKKGEDTGVFAFEKVETLPELVDIGIEPREQKAQKGGKAAYEVTIVDNHPVPACPSEEPCLLSPVLYSYKLKVIGMPFAADIPESVQLAGGEKTVVSLVIDTGLLPTRYEEGETKEETGVPQSEEGAGTAGARASTVTAGKTVQPLPATSVTVTPVGIGMEEGVEAQKKCLATTDDHEKCLTIQVKPSPAVVQTDGHVTTRGANRYRFAVRIQEEGGDAHDIAYATLVLSDKELPPAPPAAETASIPLKKGWNLVSLPGTPRSLSTGNCGKKFSGYLYLGEEHKPASLKEAEKLLGTKGFYERLSRNAFWLKAASDCSFTASIESYASYDEMSLSEGWNLVPIQKELAGKTFQEVASNCDIAKTYYWNAGTQAWEKVAADHAFTEDQINQGLTVKSNNYCELGETAVDAPPAFPEE